MDGSIDRYIDRSIDCFFFLYQQHFSHISTEGYLEKFVAIDKIKVFLDINNFELLFNIPNDLPE